MEERLFKRCLTFFVSLLAISGVGMAYIVINFIILGNYPTSDLENSWTFWSFLIFSSSAFLLVVMLLARSIEKGRLAVLKPLPKMIFNKQHFEGMTFFKWAILIIGVVIAIALLRL
jgi:hypothetical protein